MSSSGMPAETRVYDVRIILAATLKGSPYMAKRSPFIK
jgi:hypothetical protein